MDPRDWRQISEFVGHKWDLVILAHLRECPLRYTDLKIKIRDVSSDLSEGVLSKNLKRLMADGLIDQRSTGGNHRVWALTARGRQLISNLARLGESPTGDDGHIEAMESTDHGDPGTGADVPEPPDHGGGRHGADQDDAGDDDADPG